MATHPGGGASHAPDRKSLTQAEQSGEDHEAEANDPIENADDRPTARSANGEVRVWDIDRDTHCCSDHASPEPLSMCLIDDHRRYLLSIIPGAML